MFGRLATKWLFCNEFAARDGQAAENASSLARLAASQVIVWRRSPLCTDALRLANAHRVKLISWKTALPAPLALSQPKRPSQASGDWLYLYRIPATSFADFGLFCLLFTNRSRRRL